MKTNEELQKDVQDALQSEPLLRAAQVGVTVRDGIVTISGTVDCLAKKLEAEKSTLQVNGVRAVVVEIEVKISSWDRKNDDDIVTEILNTLKWNGNIPNDSIMVAVENGCVTLTGDLQWNYQKEAAKAAISHLVGVKGVFNSIRVLSEIPARIDKLVIERALKSHVGIDMSHIQIAVSGRTVIISGTVDSRFQKELAGHIAWKAPGVINVDNQLLVV